MIREVVINQKEHEALLPAKPGPRDVLFFSYPPGLESADVLLLTHKEGAAPTFVAKAVHILVRVQKLSKHRHGQCFELVCCCRTPP